MINVYLCSNSNVGMIREIWELNHGRLLVRLALGFKPGEDLGEGQG